MTEFKSTNLELANIFLDGAKGQNEILKLQIQTFMNSILLEMIPTQNLHYVQRNIKEAFTLTHQISELIDETKTKLRSKKKEGFVRVNNDPHIIELFNATNRPKQPPDSQKRGFVGFDNPGFKYFNQRSSDDRTKTNEKNDYNMEIEEIRQDFTGSQWSSNDDHPFSKGMNSEVLKNGPDEFKKYSLDNEITQPGSKVVNQSTADESFIKDSLFFKQDDHYGLKPAIRPKEGQGSSEPSSFLLAHISSINKPDKPGVFGPFRDVPEYQKTGYFSQTKSNKSELKTETEKPEVQETPNKKKTIKKERGQYRICTKATKEQVIQLCQKNPVKKVAEELNISEKNIKRWLRQGPERKKGTGRVVVKPEMEAELLKWMNEEYSRSNKTPELDEIKIQLAKIQNVEHPKISKSWCDLFRWNFIEQNQKKKTERVPPDQN